jgi:EAL domain-containing protein (putative c-di-GMP-specific phosphodiesterase class I)/DNA-binding NarL/FixJ family response regulator
MDDAAGSLILVADDDDVLRALFSEALEFAGFRTITAPNGRVALELLAEHPVDAVLLDSQMPEMGGHEVLGVIRDNPRTRTLPIILVTGQGHIDDRVRGLEAGASDYVVKPVDVTELVARVRAQLRGQAIWTRLLESQLRERATVTEALCRLQPEQTPEHTARRICAELVGLRNLDAAVLVRLTDDGSAIPLGSHGDVDSGVRVGEPLPPALARHLLTRATTSAWTEARDEQPPGASGPPLLGRTAAGGAYAPLRSQGRLLGLLAISSGRTSADAPTDEKAQAMSAAIDFAAVSAALLGPALQRQSAVSVSQAALQRVLTRGDFTPVFQPVIDLSNGGVVGYETLTRFGDGIDPQTRFTEATRVGMGLELERATMSAALKAASGRLGDKWLSVNVSPQFLSSGDPAPLMQDTDCDIVLELTEHDPIDDYADITRAVHRLGSQVRLSIDDAGAGYACLTHVLWLQPAFVKLDRGWVMGIDRDPARQALVAGLESFASRTGSTLIAEGIETEAELETLRGLRVDLGQGYLLGRPEPAAVLER